ncbi:hypothetical protein [Burkholderia sp. Bp8963]|uniref:hypothetical protein n=1 Tax=Burkholderia sp. Bp8963 TaxID=2184547 RepID=UPI002694D4EC|nr:hypothetical protein [Burkholderia sp. Bp8963]
MSDFNTLQCGDAPLMISIPHLGTEIPESLRDMYRDDALTLADTDWHPTRSTTTRCAQPPLRRMIDGALDALASLPAAA